MPFYPDPQFNVSVPVAVAFGGTASATGTGTALTAALPASGAAFLNRTAVKAVTVLTVTAPAGGFTGGVVDVLNGTNTIASVTVAAAGTAAFGTVASTNTNGTFTASGAVTLQVRGTATSAGVLAGGYAIWLEAQELYTP